MKLLFGRQVLTEPLRILDSFMLRDIDRPIQRQRDFGQHSPKKKFAIAFDPEMGFGRTLFYELQVIAVRHAVALNPEGTDVSNGFLIFVIPAEGAVMFFAEQGVSCGYAYEVVLASRGRTVDRQASPRNPFQIVWEIMKHVGQRFQMHETMLERHMDQFVRGTLEIF